MRRRWSDSLWLGVALAVGTLCCGGEPVEYVAPPQHEPFLAFGCDSGASFVVTREDRRLALTATVEGGATLDRIEWGELTEAGLEEFERLDIAYPSAPNACAVTDGCWSVAYLSEDHVLWCHPLELPEVVELASFTDGVIGGLSTCVANEWVVPDGDCQPMI